MIQSKRLLIIGFVWPEPKSSAAGSRMMQLIELFIEQEFEITFASTALNLEFSEDVSVLGVTPKPIELNAPSFDLFITELQPDVVVFDRFMVEEQFGWRVASCCPNALRILDTIDLHCLRLARQAAVKEQREFSLDDLYSDTAKREIASILRCDVSLMVSEFEVEVLQNHFKIASNLLYYLPILATRLNAIPTFEERSGFMFIGNFLHEPNWDCIKYLSEVIWPLIHAKLPDVKLTVYGAYPMQKVMELHKPKRNFCIMGRADDAIEVTKNARVVLAPIRFGAGIKGKLLDAMQCGTPSVTSSVGAEGMYGVLDWNGFIHDNPNDFAEKAVMLYQDKRVWEKRQQNGFELLEQRYKKDIFARDFMDAIQSLRMHIETHRKSNFMGSILHHHLLASTKYMSKWIEEKNK
jgi:glycosyltransferase involved in cell wall biosynthesis